MNTRRIRWTLKVIALFSVLSGSGVCCAASELTKVPNLLYHQLSTPSDPIPLDDTTVIDVQSFSAQMKYLHDSGYKTVNASDLVKLLRQRQELPAKSVTIHFDDGWRSVLAAVPVLKQYHFGATFWLIVSMIGQPGYLTWDDVAQLASNREFEFQSHTMSHPWHDGDDMLVWAHRNSVADQKRIEWELAESKRVLEEKLQQKVDLLAWPRGAYDKRLIQDAVASGYTGLFTVEWGLTKAGDDPLRIGRSYIGSRCGLDAFKQILQDGRSRQCLQESTQKQ